MRKMERDLIVYIERFNKWENVGRLICCSHKTRRSFFQPKVLVEIISHYLSVSSTCNLPKWTVLPLCVNSTLVLPEQLTNFSTTFQKRLNEWPDLVSFKSAVAAHKKCFVAGGFTCQCFYQLTWSESDIDMWLPANNYDQTIVRDFDKALEPATKRVKNGNVDKIYGVLGCNGAIVKATTDPHYAIAHFYMSVCQLGIHVTCDNSSDGLVYGDVYFTPLFLYSYCSTRMVSRVFNVVNDYASSGDSNQPSDLKLSLWNVFDDHDRFHGHYTNAPNAQFHVCSHCYLWCKSALEEDSSICRWFKRVQKYTKRFPDSNCDFIKSAN